VLIKAPAKINLTLRILSKRADGYHEISSFMRAISLFDEVGIAVIEVERESSQEILLRVLPEEAGLPEGPGNLAYRAAQLMLDRRGKRFCRIEIDLVKSIPVAAGLGGGSSDAAAVLLGLAKELAPEAKLKDIAAWGAKLGMDVPFCVYACAEANPELGYEGAGAALAEGAGETVTPKGGQGKARVVLVKPEAAIRTKDIYELYDAWEGGSADSENDLQGPCREAWPEVGETLDALNAICAEQGAAGAKVQMSGSGPAVFAWFDEAAAGAAERVAACAKTAFKRLPVYLIEAL